MIFKPFPLSTSRLENYELELDKKHCRKIGPCGLGKKALYLNSFFIDRRYYVPISAVRRVFKRVAMSRGGYTGKGIFASMAYLVVVYDDGQQKQCNFKYEQQVDDFLALLAKEQPQIKRVSAAAEERLAKRQAEREEAERNRPPLTPHNKKVVEELQQAIDYLEEKPELSTALSRAAQHKRAYECSSPSYRWVAMAITALGIVGMIYGVWSLVMGKGGFGIYFALFGLAAVFTFAGFSVLPTARNNRRSILKQEEKAKGDMEQYLAARPMFPLPARYAHPVVLQRMQRAVEDGKASSVAEALDVVKKDLKALNSDVQVSQEEYDEVVDIKPLFLNAGYQ
nr:ATPase P [uncultured Gemmiger sp.]